jgi:hypothetical protein
MPPQSQLSNNKETQGIRYSANPCDSVHKREVAEAGLEEVLDSLGNTLISPDVVLPVVLSIISKLDFADREWVLRQLQTLSQRE